MNDWLKLYRSIEDNELWFAERFSKAQAWIDLLILATYRPKTVFIRGVEIKLQPGELCCSQLTLAKRWKWNRKTVQKFLKWLENRQMVVNRTVTSAGNRISHITSVVTIQNWNAYQGDGQLNGQLNGQRRGHNTRI